MKIIGDVTVVLPYSLDFCAKGPDVEPLELEFQDISAILYFPPSLSEGTVGKSIFPTGWAWWTGNRLRLVLSEEITGPNIDVEASRTRILSAANEILRRFLNSYRWRLNHPEIYPVRIDSRELALMLEWDDGTKEALPEPVTAFFYKSIPGDAPLETSVNDTTLETLQDDIDSGMEPNSAEHWALEVSWLRGIGEIRRAEHLQALIKGEQ